VQIDVSEEIGFCDYLGLDLRRLETYRVRGTVKMLWARMPAGSLRVAMLCAPLGTAWGMQFWLRASALAVVEESLASDQVAMALKESIENLGFQPERLPSSLLQAEAFGREQRFWLGTEAEDIPHAVFRAVLVPDDEREFLAFLDRVHAYLDQLGKFFLLPVPSAVDPQTWQYEQDVRLTELLSGRPGGLKKGQSTEGWQAAIRLALQSLDGSEAETWLTPVFLEYEQVKTGYPIREADASATARAGAFLSILNMRPIGDQLENRSAAMILKLKLIKKWQWPLGLRQLHNAYALRDAPSSMLKKADSREEVEALVSEILMEGRRRYPVLFE
jgi:hypothetical protein